MKKHSISFIVVVVLLSGLIGAVMGSLLETVFGLKFLNYPLIPKPGIQIKDFYIIEELTIQLTPATIMGILLGVYLLYKIPS
ncbi:MAG: hypothetical protein NZ853_05045 [Leptospiraceae bacterium]|nr:hypothetical protein [Leptospiraceae bacterium]MDW7976686.1 hypothetical protein [Leptospiraceae bacterium]